LDLVASRIVTPACGAGPGPQSSAAAATIQRSHPRRIASRALAFRPSLLDGRLLSTCGIRGIRGIRVRRPPGEAVGTTALDHYIISYSKWHAHSGYSRLRPAPSQKRSPPRNLSARGPRGRPGFGAGHERSGKSWPGLPNVLRVHFHALISLPSLQPIAPTKRRMDKSLLIPTLASMSFFLPKLAFID